MLFNWHLAICHICYSQKSNKSVNTIWEKSVFVVQRNSLRTFISANENIDGKYKCLPFYFWPFMHVSHPACPGCKQVGRPWWVCSVGLHFLFFLYLPLWWFPFISLSLPPLYLSSLQTVNSQGVGVWHTYIKQPCYTIVSAPCMCSCMCTCLHVACVWAAGLESPDRSLILKGNGRL